ncbi:hypothetical protein MHYP_G00366090, partial [Metynnis hypsauchen]
VAALSSSDLAEVLACNLDSSMNYSRAIWNLFFEKFAASLDEALAAYSNMSLTISLRDPDVLDAIAEVTVDKFSDAQLTDAVFISKWFQERLRPFLSAVSADFLSCLSSKNFSCQTYQVVVEALSRQDQLMEEEQKWSIFTYFIYPFLSRGDLSDPSCVSSSSGSSDWLAKNFGNFSAYASLEELLILNIHFSSVEVLDSLSPEQKAELILDPNTGALENETLVKEVMTGIISSSGEEQLYVFFEMFVSITKQEQINFIENAAVRDAILNMTLTALAPNFDTFQPSQYELWFQVNLFVVLASFQPIWLLVIPGNLSCDSYKAILKGMDMSLAVLPVDLEQDLRSSREMLSQTLPKGCTPPFPVGVVAALSSSNLAEVLACNLDSSMNYSRAIWNLFFEKFAASLDEALAAYSNMSLTISLRDPDVLDAIAEVTVDKFSDAQLTDAVFISKWFQERLRPFLSAVSADFLSCLSSKNFSCQTYQVVVEALSRQDQLMEEEQKWSIFTYFIYPFLSRGDLSDPSCVSSSSGSSDWLAKNFGNFSAYASLEELLILNIHFSSVEVLDSLSPEQKAELILDPNTGALENETLVKEVMTGIISSSGEEQLYVFFEMFVSITKQEQINFIENAAVRDAILNMTLTALAPNFDTFQPSQYELWFQVNLFVVLASFQPIWLLVIPGNLSCDSYKAILKGMDMSLAVLPVDLEQDLRSSREMLSQTLPKGCTPPFPVGVVAALSSSDLAEVLACNLDSSMNYSRAIWNLFFEKFAASLDEALAAYSNMSLTISLRDPDVLDAIAEVTVDKFSDAQLTDAVFISKWFQERLRPLLSAVSADFLSCLSSKNFSCQTYQVVVEALSRQDQLMEEEQKWSIFTYFIYPFLSRGDLSDPSCVSSSSGSSDWLAKNFGNFSAYASLEELLILNIHFSSVEVLDSLSPEQKAELILDPNTGALENETLVKEVMTGIISSSGEEQLYVFFEMFVSITKQEQINFIENAAVRDAILNMTLTALAPNFDTFQPSQYELWFQVNLFVVLASFQPIWLLVIPGNLSCDSYKAILKGMDMSLAVLPVDLEQELRSSREMLSQTLPKGCTPPFPVGVVAALSSSDLAEVLACNLDSSMNYSRAIWNLFFEKFAASLDEALAAYSNMSLTISLRDPDVLDAIAEVTVDKFSDAQLTDAVFISKWFQERLRPFLSAVSADFLSCLSSKNFSCQTYQVVVEALSRQDQLMEEEHKWSIITYFIYPFLSRGDLSDPSCVSSSSGSSDWLAKNFGNFSAYASLEELLILNIHFSSVEVLDSLSPEQKAELILDPNTGALENETLVKEVMTGIISSSGEEQLYVFFEMFVSITKQEQINFIENAAVRDAILNMTLTALAPNFDTFQPSQYELWFQVNLFVVLASFQPIWLLVIPGNLSCDSYKAILKGMDMSLAVLPVDLEQDLRSSREMLSQTLPKGCTPPFPVGVVAALSSSDLAEVLACNLDSSMNYSRAIWNLFFEKFAASLDEALATYSNMSLTISLRDPDVLDAIAEVTVDKFSDAQLTDAVFISKWFQERLRPFLSAVSADFLSCLSSKNFSCQTYQVVVEALSRQDQLMEEEQKWSIFTYFIYPFLSRGDLSDPSCVSSSSGSSDWLAKNFGNFSAYASLEELLILNIHFSSVEVLDSLSPEQKAELILDPNTGALENETLVKEVMTGIISSSGEEQLYVFFEMFVSITKQEQINFIENAAVRDAILNMTLTALAPNFDTFQPSQYELWFQVNLFVVLASFQPIWLLVIPGNLSCDSYKAILKGMDMSLAVLPIDLEQDLRSSREMLSQTLPKGCTPPFPVGVVAALSSSDLAEVLACNLDSSMNYSRAIWNLFFEKFAASLDEALAAYSNMSLTISLRDPDVLDAIAEVTVDKFSDAQLTDAVFISKWFQERLRPFLSAVSADFLSCLSSKNFSCQTYQVVVEALSRQDQLMEEEQKWSIFTYFIYPFLSRGDLSDPSCVSSSSGSSDWLAKNFGNFSAYASLEELLILNIHFSSVEVLDSLSPEQKAELILDPNTGALENETLVKEVMTGIISSSGEEQLYVFFEMFVSITKQEQINFIENAAVRDAILNMTLTALAPNFDTFQPSQYELWFQVNLFVVLASFQPIWLLVIPGNLSCDSYKAILKGMDMSLAVLPIDLEQDLRSSREMLSQTLPKGCTPPFPVGVVAALSSSDLAEVLACNLDSSMNYSRAIWNLFFEKFAASLDEALAAYSNMSLTISLRDPDVLDAIAEVTVDKFSDAQLTDAVFISKWFQERLRPFLSAVSADFLSCLSSKNFSCQTYQVVVEALSRQDQLMEEEQKWSIFTYFIYPFLSRGDLSDPSCVSSSSGSSDWLAKNFGNFSAYASLEELLILNIHFSSVEVLDSLSPEQKAELILDPNTGALENETLVKEVMTGIISSSGEEQLYVFFEMFVSITKQEQINFIENAAVRDAILNMTLTALAPNFDTFQPSQYELWFQVNLFVVLASFQPIWLLVIPGNLSCDSYKAILKGMDMSLAVLPIDLEQDLRSSREMLSQTLPKGCTPPFPVGVVAALSSSDLAEVLACNLDSSMNYSRAIWNLFFKKFAASLDEALAAYSNMSLTISLRDPDVLDAIAEVTVDKFSDAQLTDAVFISKWFQERLRPFLSAVSADFLSCLSSKNFSCQTYQVVVEALSRQDQLMEEEQKWSIFTYFIYPFLSRGDLSDPSCVSSSSGSSDWLAKNFGNFSAYASLEELLILNIHFSSVEVLDSLSPEQKAELILDPNTGALENETLVKEVMTGIISSSGEEQFYVFFEMFVSITKQEQINFIENAAVRDAILNMTLTALAPNFDTFQPSQYELWFQVNLFVVLASFQPIWLLVIPGNLSCDSYKAILKGMDMSLAVLPVDLEQDLRSSREMLSQTLPKGCTPPFPVGVVAALSSSDLAEVLACNLDSSMNYSRAIWNLFFEKFAASLDEALAAYSNMSLTISLRDPDVLDAIAEVTVDKFSDAQLTDAVFISKWFQERLRPFLSAVSADFLSCLSSKNFSCQTYQVVVEALSRQDQLMEEEQKWSIFTYFIYPFLSRGDLSDPSCVSSSSVSSDWLAKNFGNFSAYASLEELLILNIHFSSVEVLDSLSPEQKAELILDPNTGALENETLVKEVMTGIISSSGEEQLYVFFEMFVSITKQEQINFIENAAVRDAILNMTLTALAPNFDTFQPSQYELWFQVNLFVVLASFQPIWLLVIPGNLSCDSYKAILKGMDMSLAVLPVDLEQDLRSSREMLSQTLPKGCTPPFPVGVVAALSSSDLAEVLACNLDSSMNYSRAIWNLFFEKFAASLDEALAAYSNMSLTISLRDPDVLDAIAEVTVDKFSDAQLTDAVFISKWFQERLRPFLSAVSADFLSCLSSKNFSCQTYQVVVEALSRQDQLMEEEQKWSIFTYFIYPFLSRGDLSDPSCVSSSSGSSDWLAKNFGNFSAYASLEELLILNIHFSSVEVLDSLSPEQKAELILDPNTGALENETLVKEVMTGIISSSGEEQLYVFFEMFVSITKQEQINFIENAAVRDAILNMTLTALAPNFDTFQPSQYELWFQVNLFVVLASFQPIWLLVIPGNLSCDSYKAILKGMDMSLAVLPVDLEQDLRSSREMLSQTLPKGCTPPFPVGVVAALSSSDLAEVLACNLDSSMNYSRAIWNLFFEKFAASLDEALAAYSNMSLTISLRDPDVLDAIAEVTVDKFSDAQLTDAVFISKWFQERLRPFLSAVSADFLSCLSSKNFSCQTYQVVVEALSRQDQLMEEEQKWSIFTYFIYPFLSRGDLSDPSCVSSSSGSSDWLAKNFGNFSAYASLEELLILNIHFSSVEVLDSLSPEQKAELILDPNTGALENETLVKEVMTGIISSSGEEQLYVFFEMFVSITKQEQINFIENAAVRDAILNMTLTALAPNFDTFQPSQYELWFQVNLFVVLASFQPIWLLVIPGNLSCDSYKAILKGMDMSLAVLPVDLEQDLRSSREMLSQTLPKGCTPPFPVGVVAALSSSDLAEVLACNLDSSMNYSRAIWNLFFEKFAASLDEALAAYSNMSLTISLRDPDVLDAIAEVTVDKFSDAQLTDAVFISKWFQERLRPFLSAVSADFLSCLSSKNFSCQTYQVVVEALSRQDQLMEEEQKWSIFTYFIYPFLSRGDLSDPSCVSSSSGSSDWLAKNFGNFSAYASLEELLILNIHFSSVEVLDSLSPEQKAELILDPNTGALENETLVKEVMTGIISSSGEEQLYVFFEMFVSITKQEQINFIENAAVRDAILNMTLTALAPNFDTFQPSQYELWFQVNLFVVLASFQPIWLLVIPGNLSCDSYKAILKGMDMSLAVLPVDLEQDLRSSREMLSQTLPKGCTPPFPVGVVAALSSSDLAEVLACNLDSSMNYSRAIWNLFFEKFAASLDEALAAYSNMSLTISLRDPDVLDAIAEVTVDKFSDAQLTDAVFISKWFQERLRPFLSAVSTDFLSCLSSKNFSCQTYQVVVEALSRQDQLMEEEQKWSIFTYFIYPFLSRGDLSDPSCVSSSSGSSDWLAKNFGNFSAYASLEELLILNIQFSSVEVLDSLSPEQKAELILDPNTGALENETLVKEVMTGIISSSGEEQLYVFFEMFVSITKQEQINFIENAAVRDAILNMTLTALAPNFDTFQPSQYELWFQVNLFVVLASFQPIWLLVIPGNLSCDSYKAILKGMDMSLAVLPVDLEQDLRSSREMLSQTLPKGCTPPFPVGVVAALSSSDLAEVLACNLDSSMNYSRAIWNLFFEKFAASLDEALAAYSNMSLTISLRDPDVLDAIAEVTVDKFSDAQLTDAVFISKWFQERLRPFLSAVSADFLSCLSSKNFSCQTYQVVVEALSRQDQLMEEEQKWSIFTYFIYPFLSRGDLSDPSCVSSSSGSSDWLAKNFGNFSAYASLEELLILNIHFSSVEVLNSLSPEQKAELILDPNTGALENETLVKEVMTGIISSSGEEQLYVFFEMFVSITKQEQINFIENAAVRDAILNMTLTALAPNFDTFQPSQYELWFQVNLFVVLASFQPIWLLVIPGNLSCDSYKAILKGMDMSLAVLPVDLEQDLRSSREMLSQTLPKGCTPPFPVGVVAALSSSDLAEVLACNLDSSMNYSRAIWNLFFEKFAASLDEALAAYSNMSLTISLRDPDVLDAIAEVTVDKFSDAQLTDAVFISKWFQERLRPFLSAVSTDFLSCLSSKNFSCQTYQVVVEALSRQDQLMEEEQKWSIFTYFIYPFLSRGDLSDPSCVSSSSGSSDWLAKNFGNFSAYASLEELLILNIQFSSVEVLDSLSPEQKAELILDPNTGALENETLVKEVMTGIISSSGEEQLYVFFEMFVSITKQEQINFIENAAVRDAILNMTLTALAPNFDTFQPSQYELWFQVNLFVVLASFQPIWLLVIPGNLSCDSYKAILKGMDMSLAVLPVDLEQDLRSSREMLSQTLPKGCTPPFPVGVVAALSSSDLAEVLACNLDSSMNYSRAIWNLFFEKFAASLDEALAAYSNMSLTISLRDPDVLDAIAEVTVDKFSDAQLTDAVFISKWFQERLRPFLSAVSTDFLSCLSSKNFSCQTYQVVVEALSRQDQLMEEEQKWSIFTYFIYPFLSRGDLSDPSCVSSSSGSSDWLAKNFGNFSAYASLEELLILNIQFSSVEVLNSLSPEQKAELILDPNTGALENETLVKEVMTGIISSSGEEQLYVFFEMFVSITKQEQINFIENAAVRDAILNMTLTALAPNFDTFQPSQYELWFQVNLFVVLASFQPIWLLVIPGNLSCDSYKAILKGMDMSLAVLPVDLEQDLRSSREMLSQTLPKGCTPPFPVGVVAALSSSDLAEVLACNLDSSMNYSRAIWNLFFEKFAASLDEALAAYSNMSLTISLRDPDVLDAIAEVTVDKFSDAQLTDAVFISKWFQERLRPFLSAVSTDFLSCLSSKNFSCQTYQVVVEALSRQDQLMEEEQKWSIFTYFIYPFLSRGDLSDPSCVSSSSGSSDWLAKNFGNFSAYASLEELLILNIQFSSVEVLDSLSPEQKAELILDPNTGALENETLVKEVMTGIISSSGEEQLYVFFEMFVSITKQVSCLSMKSKRDVSQHRKMMKMAVLH